MAKAFGIITSSAEHKVEGMQNYRSIGAFSFLGRYRIIDFPISNLSNSNIDRIQVYISSNPRSIVSTIGTGRHYNINSKRGNIQLCFPNESMVSAIYNTNINAFIENLDKLKEQHEEYVVIAPSCMVFKQDFDAFLQDHAKSGADVSVLYHKVTDGKTDYNHMNVVQLDGNRVTGITPDLCDKDEENVCMECYVMTKDQLLALIEQAQAISSIYSLADVINAKIGDLDVRAVEHTGFFAPITSLKAYYRANTALLDSEKADTLFDPKWPIYTRTTDSCPTQFFSGSEIKNSYISNGCLIKGTVQDSIIGHGVTIGKGAVVKNSVILAYTKIEDGAVIENQVVDKHSVITAGTKVVSDPDTIGYVRKRDIL